MASSVSGSSSGGGGSSRQEVRQLSREVTALVTVSNPGPRFSALATLSDSEDSGDGVGLGKKRRHRAVAIQQQQLDQPPEPDDDQPPSAAGQQDSLYDAQGRIAVNGQDACDCLTLGCPGCYYPCVKCGSAKCGFECRVGRNSYVKSVTVESVGNLVIPNRLITGTGAAASDSDVE